MSLGSVITGVGLLLVAAAIAWLSQDSNRNSLRPPASGHEPRWVSGPGGGNETIVCDVCGLELTEHPDWGGGLP